LIKRGTDESTIEYEGQQLTISNDNLADSLTDVVKTESVTVVRLVNLRDEKNGALSDEIAEKGEILSVVSVSPEDLDSSTGMVNWYEVEKDGQTYWLAGQYALSGSNTLSNNGENIQYSQYWDAYYGDGYSRNAYIEQCDYTSSAPVDFEDNPRPESLHAVHVTLENLLQNPDFYLALKDQSSVNAFVVEMKDEWGQVKWSSDAASSYLSDASAAGLTYDLQEIAQVLQHFDEAGYYMIARLAVFKDPVFAAQNPSESIDGLPSWTSPYSRKAWMYNVALAVELAPYFDEINFDYVRFPEGLAQYGDTVDLKNTYSESKAAAIQGFVQYAADELHPLETYVSTDVFALTVTAQDDQDLGQFVPALMNAADAVYPMAYSDHFEAGSMGIAIPWQEQGHTVQAYSEIAWQVLVNAPDHAKYGTWIQGYGNTSQDVADQIAGLQAEGFSDWLFWAGNGDPADVEAKLSGMQEQAP
jgi:hypothetical protein